LKGSGGNSCYLVDKFLEQFLVAQLFPVFRQKFNGRRSKKFLKGLAPSKPSAVPKGQFKRQLVEVVNVEGRS
jgi:hypothetical protein